MHVGCVSRCRPHPPAPCPYGRTLPSSPAPPLSPGRVGMFVLHIFSIPSSPPPPRPHVSRAVICMTSSQKLGAVAVAVARHADSIFDICVYICIYVYVCVCVVNIYVV